MGTKTYKVFTSLQGDRKTIKQGWSWPSFFFPGVWFLFKKMWKEGFCVFVVVKALELSVEHSGLMPLLFLIGVPVLAVTIAFKANEWHCRHLVRAGYIHVDTITGE